MFGYLRLFWVHSGHIQLEPSTCSLQPWPQPQASRASGPSCSHTTDFVSSPLHQSPAPIMWYPFNCVILLPALTFCPTLEEPSCPSRKVLEGRESGAAPGKNSTVDPRMVPFSQHQHFSGCCTSSVTFWVQKPFVLFICPALKLFFKEIYWFLTHCNQKSFLAFTFRLWKAQMLSFILKVCLYRIPKWFQYVSVCGSNAIKPDRWTVSTEPGSWHDHLPQAPVSVRRRPLDQPTVHMLYSSLIGWKVRPLSIHFITHVTLTLWHSWS